jgi:O-antigen/teichoic acid export membrane protein
VKQIILIYSEKVLQVFFGFFVTYLLVNHFSAEDFGVYKYIVSLVALFLIFILLGFNVTNIRYIPEYIVKTEKQKINYQIIFFLAVQIVVIFITFTVLWIVFNVGYLDTQEKIDYEILLVWFVLATLKAYIGESLHIAFSERVQLTQIRILLYFIQFLILVYAVMFSQVTILELQNYLVIYVLIEVVLLVISIWSIHRKNVGEYKLVKSDLSETYPYAAYNYGFSWSNFARDNAATILVVGYLFSFTEVAYYSIALLIPNMVRGFTPSKVFSGFLMPDFVKKYTVSGNTQEVFDGLNFIGKLNVAYLVPAVLFSVFSYEYVITLFFNEQYAKQTFYLSVFLFVNIFLIAFVDLLMLSTNIFKRPDIVFKVNLLSVSNIAFLFLFYEAGMISIGMANLLSTAITVFVFLYVSKQIWGSSIKMYFLDIRVVMYITFLTLMFLMLNQLSSLEKFLIGFFLCFLAFIVFLRTSFFSKSEKDLIKKVLPTRLRPFL